MRIVILLIAWERKIRGVVPVCTVVDSAEGNWNGTSALVGFCLVAGRSREHKTRLAGGNHRLGVQPHRN
jgi:hypothetical protein